MKTVPLSGVLSSAGIFYALARQSNTIMSIKSTIAAIAASPFLLAGAAFAGPYVNVESNLSYPDGEYSSASTDIHVGYEGVNETGKLAYYVQGGPAVNHSESADDTDLDFSGKVGVSYAVAEATSVYGELSGATDEDTAGESLVNWGAKAGVKFTF